MSLGGRGMGLATRINPKSFASTSHASVLRTSWRVGPRWHHNTRTVNLDGTENREWCFHAGGKAWWLDEMPALDAVDLTYDDTELDWGNLGSPRVVDLVALGIVALHLYAQESDND